MKVVISRSWGGFPDGNLPALSPKNIFGRPRAEVADLPRTDTWLVEMVEANPGSGLVAVEVSDGVRWTIFVYDSQEVILLGLPERLVRLTDAGATEIAVDGLLDARQLVGA